VINVTSGAQGPSFKQVLQVIVIKGRIIQMLEERQDRSSWKSSESTDKMNYSSLLCLLDPLRLSSFYTGWLLVTISRETYKVSGMTNNWWLQLVPRLWHTFVIFMHWGISFFTSITIVTVTVNLCIGKCAYSQFMMKNYVQWSCNVQQSVHLHRTQNLTKVIFECSFAIDGRALIWNSVDAN
jgi:hypothetical protein